MWWWQNTEGISWWCHIPHNNFTWSFSKSVMMTKIQKGYLDDAMFHTTILLNHSVRLWWWQNAKGISWGCYDPHNNFTWSSSKSVVMTKIQKGYLDDALIISLDHAECAIMTKIQKECLDQLESVTMEIQKGYQSLDDVKFHIFNWQCFDYLINQIDGMLICTPL